MHFADYKNIALVIQTLLIINAKVSGGLDLSIPAALGISSEAWGKAVTEAGNGGNIGQVSLFL